MEHEELRRLLDSMINRANASYQKTGCLLPFAMMVSAEGKISLLASATRAQQTL